VFSSLSPPPLSLFLRPIVIWLSVLRSERLSGDSSASIEREVPSRVLEEPRIRITVALHHRCCKTAPAPAPAAAAAAAAAASAATAAIAACLVTTIYASLLPAALPTSRDNVLIRHDPPRSPTGRKNATSVARCHRTPSPPLPLHPGARCTDVDKWKLSSEARQHAEERARFTARTIPQGTLIGASCVTGTSTRVSAASDCVNAVSRYRALSSGIMERRKNGATERKGIIQRFSPAGLSVIRVPSYFNVDKES